MKQKSPPGWLPFFMLGLIVLYFLGIVLICEHKERTRKNPWGEYVPSFDMSQFTNIVITGNDA